MRKFIFCLILSAVIILAGIFTIGLNVTWYNFSALGAGLIVFGGILFIIVGVLAVFYAVEHNKI